MPEHVCPKYILGLCYNETPGELSTLEFNFSPPFTVGRNAGTVCRREFVAAVSLGPTAASMSPGLGMTMDTSEPVSTRNVSPETMSLT